MTEDWENKANLELEFRCASKECNAVIKKPRDTSLAEVLCFTCYRKLAQALR